MTPENVNNLATFSDSRVFQFDCILQNDQTATHIKKDTIKELVIEDTMINWYARGYVDLVNPRGALELSVAQIQNTTRDTYIFRNDSTDYLIIEMAPNIGGSEQNDQSANDDFYVMKYIFSVYSVKDITPPGQQQDKIKRLYFVDYKYHNFAKLNSVFTTSAYLSGAVAHMSDREREIPSGDAIRHLINETLPDQKFNTSWESGGSMIDYTSPANNKCIDDLNDLVDMHISDDASGNQPCFLYLDRNLDQWSLIPIGTLFDRATMKNVKGESIHYVPGIWQTEHFTFGRDVSVEEHNTVNLNMKNRVPMEESLYINYNLGASSCINNYRFVEMHGDINQSLLTTHPIHQNNIRTKEFMINMSSANTASVATHIKKQVISNMMVDVKAVDDVPMSMNVDGPRFLNQTLEHVYVNSDMRTSMLAAGRNKLLKKLLLHSNAIEFTVPGETVRRSTRFISIESNKSASSHESSHNDKLEGQYLILGVTHNIKNNLYTNKIIGIKPYNYTHVHNSDKQILDSFLNEQN